MAVEEQSAPLTDPRPLPGEGREQEPPVLAALGALMAALARVRTGRRKAVHPSGRTVRGVVHRGGLDVRVGVPWLDEPGRDEVAVRFSRGAGLPRALPDMLGLALQVRGRDGRPFDLLLTSTGLSPLRRHLLVPHRDPLTTPYTTVLSHRSPAGPLMVAAIPARPGPGFVLAVASPGGEWRPFASLEVDPAAVLPDVAFDPVRHALPGLPPGRRMAAVRRAAYAGSRRGRGVGLEDE